MTRIVTLDIERQSAIAGGIWQLKQQGYLRPNQILVPPRTICLAWKWMDEDKVNFSSEWDPYDDGTTCAPTSYGDTGLREVYPGHEAMIRLARNVLDEADYVIGWNSARFDMGHLRDHMAEYSLAPPSPWTDVDLIKTSRSKFGFMSHKLEEAAPHFGLGHKLSTEPGLWDKLRWLPYGDPYSVELQRLRGLMRDYNKRDVELTEQVFYKMRAWIPRLNLYGNPDAKELDDDTRCRRCNSDDIQWRGYKKNATRWYHEYFCKSCRGWGSKTTSVYAMGTTSS